MPYNTLYSRFLHLVALLSIVAAVHCDGQYCIPTYKTGCSTGVEINDFILPGDAGTSISDLATGCSISGSFSPFKSYRDMSATMSVTMSPGGTYFVTTTTGTLNFVPTGVQIFIDFNNDNSFMDPGECVGGGVMNAGGATTLLPVAIPHGVPSGTYRMRVIVSGDQIYPYVYPCPSYLQFSVAYYKTGEVHDYSVVINALTTTCGSPTGVTATSVTDTSAIVNWVEPSNSLGTEFVVSGVSGSPVGSGTATATSSLYPGSLSPETLYFVSLRDSCNPTILSPWVTYSFNTLPKPICNNL